MKQWRDEIATVGRCVRALGVLAALAGLGGCGEDGATAAGDTAGVDSEAPLLDTSAGADTAVADTATPDEDSAAGDTVPVPGGFGAPCNGNVDCDSGWCVEGQAGYVCTKECLETCPGGFDCKSIQNSGGDVTFLCLPRVKKLCVPCLQDFQCAGGACLSVDGEGQCAYGCEGPEGCPDGFVCAEDATGAKTGTWCQPASGSCSCTTELAGVQRTCVAESGLGTCYGFETCDAQLGWTGCTARTPSAEACDGVDDDCNGLVDDGLPAGESCLNTVEGVGACGGVSVCFGPAGWVCQGPTPEAERCDYKDNDCDGETDEGFAAGGVYAAYEHCGSCNTSCAVGFPNATATRCQAEGGAPVCVVDTCAPGFTKLNAYQCVPDIGSVCQPCTSSAQCIGEGSACVALDDGLFCAKACVGATDCGAGFSCSQVPGVAAKQCLPTSGSCTCDGTNTALSRACAVTWTPPDPSQPTTTCSGTERCTPDGWGACELPAEVCDGIDNDCDGAIDDPFRTDGRYTTLAHCGACNINCLAIAPPNAAAACRTSTPVPTCGYTCTGGAIDVNGLSDDGCECVPLAGDDLAGDGVDSNCDGLDGDAARGVFVAKDGDDAWPGTRDLPVVTIGRGLALAVAQSKRDVYVATGVYSENLRLAAGVGVFGGYNATFDERDPLRLETAILGQAPDAERPGTVTAVGLGGAAQGETLLVGFTIFGVNAANLPGTNSYAVYLRNCGAGLTLAHNRIFGGPGGAGAPGSAGQSGAVGLDGAPGVAAHDSGQYALPFADCKASAERAGGGAGARTCGATNVGGGLGGYADCPVYGAAPAAASGGQAGKGAGGGAGGVAGWDSKFCTDNATAGCPNCNSCFTPPDDNAGSGASGGVGSDGAHGARGLGCTTSSGAVVAGHWSGGAGAGGASGSPGAGGGGGGAGGGVYLTGTACLGDSGGLGSDDVGGSGGGGGSGGCAATGGTGGTSGGGSFAIFLANDAAGAKPTLVGNTLQRGHGGAGGPGGPGGPGGAGGSGGLGGAPGEVLTGAAYDKTWCANGGGAGGDGGDGGHGGGGGGGCGGASYGIFVWAPDGGPGSYKTQNTFAAGGQGGLGGLPGASLGHSVSADQYGTAGASQNTNF